ncbi:MAG: HAD family phosphatase [Anaerolineae bacterium]|jgi:sugar-phosphatase|nr:HAD family phosphatase [Anaerolineae bacterium]
MIRLDRFQAVIFDMDGLLVDSEIVWHAAEYDLFTALGVTYTDEARALGVGLRVDEFIAVLHAHFGLTVPVQTLIDDLNRMMVERIPREVKPKAGAPELLAYLKGRGVPMAVASNSSASIIATTMTAQGWNDLLPIQCTADDEKAGKPAPDVYLTAARRLGVDPTRSVGVEDSPRGAMGVVNAGMTCLAVPDLSHTQPAAFASITPTVFTDLHAVLAWLTEEEPV